MAYCFLQHTVEAIARKVFNEAGSQQRVNFSELIRVHDPVTPRSVHIHEVEAGARIARADLGPIQHYRFSCRDSGNDSGIEARPRVPDFGVCEWSGDKDSHAARDDLVSRKRTFGFDYVCLKGGIIEERFPNTKSVAASDDLVSQARRLNLETLRKVGFRDWPPVHDHQVSFRSLEQLPTSRRIRHRTE
jgi:hypothetical protein